MDRHSRISQLWTELIRPHFKLFLAACVAFVAAVAFGQIADGVVEESDLTTLDSPLARLVVEHRNGGLTPVADFFTFLGGEHFLLPANIAFLAFLLLRKWYHLAVVAFLTAACALGITALVKVLFGRQRPPQEHVLGIPLPDYSFPSGHTLNGTVFFGMVFGLIAMWLWQRNRKLVVIPIAAWAVIAVLIAWSRMYLGFHWLTDVLGGLAAAVCVLAIGAASTRGYRTFGLHT